MNKYILSFMDHIIHLVHGKAKLHKSKLWHACISVLSPLDLILEKLYDNWIRDVREMSEIVAFQ